MLLSCGADSHHFCQRKRTLASLKSQQFSFSTGCSVSYTLPSIPLPISPKKAKPLSTLPSGNQHQKTCVIRRLVVRLTHQMQHTRILPDARRDPSRRCACGLEAGLLRPISQAIDRDRDHTRNTTMDAMNKALITPDFLALGLGGTNMMSMWWTVAMGRQ